MHMESCTVCFDCYQFVSASIYMELFLYWLWKGTEMYVNKANGNHSFSAPSPVAVHFGCFISSLNLWMEEEHMQWKKPVKMSDILNWNSVYGRVVQMPFCVCVENSLEDIILIIPVFPGALRICIVCDQLTPRNPKGIFFFQFWRTILFITTTSYLKALDDTITKFQLKIKCSIDPSLC